jgi:hypothetical protein
MKFALRNLFLYLLFILSIGLIFYCFFIYPIIDSGVKLQLQLQLQLHNHKSSHRTLTAQVDDIQIPLSLPLHHFEEYLDRIPLKDKVKLTTTSFSTLESYHKHFINWKMKKSVVNNRNFKMGDTLNMFHQLLRHGKTASIEFSVYKSDIHQYLTSLITDHNVHTIIEYSHHDVFLTSAYIISSSIFSVTSILVRTKLQDEIYNIPYNEPIQKLSLSDNFKLRMNDSKSMLPSNLYIVQESRAFARANLNENTYSFLQGPRQCFQILLNLEDIIESHLPVEFERYLGTILCRCNSTLLKKELPELPYFSYWSSLSSLVTHSLSHGKQEGVCNITLEDGEEQYNEKLPYSLRYSYTIATRHNLQTDAKLDTRVNAADLLHAGIHRHTLIPYLTSVITYLSDLSTNITDTYKFQNSDISWLESIMKNAVIVGSSLVPLDDVVVVSDFYKTNTMISNTVSKVENPTDSVYDKYLQYFSLNHTTLLPEINSTLSIINSTQLPSLSHYTHVEWTPLVPAFEAAWSGLRGGSISRRLSSSSFESKSEKGHSFNEWMIPTDQSKIKSSGYQLFDRIAEAVDELFIENYTKVEITSSKR